MTAVALGSLAFINLWDFPVFAGILGAVMLVKAFGEHRGAIVPAVASTARTLLPVVALAVVLYLPFYLSGGGADAVDIAVAGREHEAADIRVDLGAVSGGERGFSAGAVVAYAVRR